MNQFVIDMAGSRPELRPGLVSDSRLLGAGSRNGPIRPAWPFLVNSSSRDKQAHPQDSGVPAGFAS